MRHRKVKRVKKWPRLKMTKEMVSLLRDLEETRAKVFKIEGPDCAAIGIGIAIFRVMSRLGLLRHERQETLKLSRRGSQSRSG